DPCCALLSSGRSIATNPASARMSVDLPDPDAPMRATISPRVTEKEMSSSTRTPRSKDFEIRRTSIGASVDKPDLLLGLGVAAACDNGMKSQQRRAFLPRLRCLERPSGGGKRPLPAIIPLAGRASATRSIPLGRQL